MGLPGGSVTAHRRPARTAKSDPKRVVSFRHELWKLGGGGAQRPHDDHNVFFINSQPSFDAMLLATRTIPAVRL
jgi:hypothetical protein